MHLSAHVAMSVGFRINGDKQLKNTSSVIQMCFKKYSKSKSAVLSYTNGGTTGYNSNPRRIKFKEKGILQSLVP